MHIIYFVVHDLGRHLGCYGRPVPTPNLDRFAGQSVRFDRAFCSSPACSPSRGCAMTGQYAHTNGLVGLSHMGWSLRPERRTMVDDLNDAGFETVHVGFSHERHPQHNRYQLDFERHWHDARIANTVDVAGAFLQSRDVGGRPIYLNVGTQEVHSSGWASLSAEEASRKYGRPVDPARAYVPPHLPDTENVRLQMAKFEACIGYMDEQFGRFMTMLEETGFLDRSLVIFTTDHGIAGNGAKGTLYDAGTEIALLVRPPGASEPAVIDHLIQNIDIAPTLLEAAGVPIPPRMQGRSAWPLLSGGGYVPNDAIFAERNFHGERVPPWPGYSDYYDPSRAVRTSRWHYLRHYFRRPRRWLPGEPVPPLELEDTLDATSPLSPIRPCEELFDTQNDPDELTDLAADPEYQEVRAELAERLDRWMGETGDPLARGEVPVRPDPPGWGEGWPAAPQPTAPADVVARATADS